MRTPKRLRIALLLAVLLVPLATTSSAVDAQVYVVRGWQSPTYGFTIDYRIDAFWQESESAESGYDILVLRSDAGWFSVEAMPVSMTIDQCVEERINEVAAMEGNHEVPTPISNGVGLIRSTQVDSSGLYTDHTRRIDCIAPDAGDYLVRFMHFATSVQHGIYETAARDIRASYRPGYPANNPLPANVTDPDGTLEVAVMPFTYATEPPTDLKTLLEPNRLLTVEFVINSVSTTDALLETRRIIIAGVGPAISHVWIISNTLVLEDDIIIRPGSGVVGHLTFAIPATATTVTFCYQHATDADCTELGEYDIGGVYDGGPNTRPRINPGR